MLRASNSWVPDGILTELTSRILSRGLEVEMVDHLGYEKGDPAGWGSGNNRNGSYDKTVQTDAGTVGVEMPRDRNATFEPQLIPKHQRRLSGFNDLVISLVARGMTVRDTQAHLQEIYGTQVSPELISKVTDAIIPELREWQQRPLDEMYPIMYLDAIVVKVRTDGHVRNRPVYIALAVDVEGRKHVLGLWLGKGDEGSKFWLSVLTELHNRGLDDVLIVCCDGLTGFGDAIEAVWPETIVQTCVVHLIRNSMRYCSWKDRKAVTRALRSIYKADTVDAAAGALDDFESEWGDQYPAIVDVWRRNWERFTPFLEFNPAIRKIIYTTNAVESLNYQLRKVTKTRGHFPLTTPYSRSSTSPYATSETTEEVTSAPGPRAGNKHSTRSPSPFPDASTQQHEPTTSHKELDKPLCDLCFWDAGNRFKSRRSKILHTPDGLI